MIMKQKSIGNPITKKVLVMTLILMSFIGMAGSAQAEEVGIEINVAPSTLVLDSSGEWVTVHTNIDYYDAVWGSIKLNGVDVYKTHANDCGDLVATFEQKKIKNTIGSIEIEEGEATMTLTGTLNGDTFSATDTIRVIDK